MDADRHPAEPARVLGPIDATCVVVGAVIGVGIFLNPGQVARLTGDGGLALTAWAIAGGIALCGALTFAALGTRYQANGAHYEVLRDAYGPFPAFLFVFCNATAIQGGAVGVIALMCVDNLAVASGVDSPEGGRRLAAAFALIVGLAGANAVGVRWGSWIQNLTVFFKVAVLLIVTAMAAASDTIGPQDPIEAQPILGGHHPVAAVLAALVPCLFAYGGWQHSLWIAGEIREPRRNLPRAIIGGMVLVVAVYLLANWSYLRLLGVERLASSRSVAADSAAVVWPRWGGRLIAATVAVSAFGVLNAQLLSGPRLVYGMARDGRFFAPFARLSPRFGTPIAAIVMIAGTAIALLAAAGEKAVDLLTIGAVYIDAVFFTLTGVALFILRARYPGAIRAPGHPVAAALFVIGEIGVVIGSFLNADVLAATLTGTGWIAAASVVYYVVWVRRARQPG